MVIETVLVVDDDLPTVQCLAGSQEWNKRPSPTEVRERFDGGLDDGALAETVALLRADPNWHVACSPGSAECTLHLVYSPTGEDVRLALRPVGALWRQGAGLPRS